MSDLIQAADSIKKMAKQYQHMVVAAEALERIGSLDQAEQEVKGRLNTINLSVASAEQELNELKGKTAEVNADIESTLAHAKAEADILRSEAKQSASNQVNDAQAAVKSIEDSAKSEAARIIAAAKNQAILLQEDIAVAKADLATTRELSNKAEADLERIEKALADAKASLRKFAG